jgi:aryl sulfotransferase
MEAPYIDPTILVHGFPFQRGDIVISVPAKCGTNWTMFLVYSVLSGGDITFDDLYERVPWLEFKWNQTQTLQERVAFLENCNYNTPGHRTFKTHVPVEPAGPLPFQSDVKYIFTGRNPYDMILSLAHFFQVHNDEFFECWKIDAKSFFDGNESTVQTLERDEFPYHLFQSYAAAWDLRHKPNVLLLHFTDLKKDLSGQIRRTEKFLDKSLTEDEFGVVLEHCSFRWMKDHENQFNVTSLGYRKADGSIVALLEPSAILRKGAVGEHNEGLSAEHRQRVENVMRSVIGPNEELIQWILNGSL